VNRLAILAALILAVVALAGAPPPSCATLKVSVQYIDVGKTETITVTLDATQWGIPRLGNRIVISRYDTVTVAADPQPSIKGEYEIWPDGVWYARARVSRISGYGLAVYTYTINCSGTIMTWTQVKKTWEGDYESELLFAYRYELLTLHFYISRSAKVPPTVSQVVPGADGYDVDADWPKSTVTVLYDIDGPEEQLSGLRASTPSNPSWNYGEKVASYVPQNRNWCS